MSKKHIPIYITVVISCLIMALVDSLWQPDYAIKSAVKILIFGAIPVCVLRLRKESFFFLRWDFKSFAMGLVLGAITLLVVLTGYYLLKPYLDLSAIPQALSADAGITAGNFVYVSIYISLCNSFLEEFLFRGYTFLCPASGKWKLMPSLFSAVCFAAYHCAIMDGWFSSALYTLLLVALLGCGLLFNYLDTKRHRIWTSWLVHLFANLAINLIGMDLLEII